jgi:uncharacterized protein
VEPDAVEIRVIGCLIEKQRTTPDTYPLTLNALRLACNQSTNRDPVVDYDESTIRGALERLGRRKWTTLASWSNRRAMKYRHTLDSALGLSEPEMAVLCVLMLRGPQTPGELKQRTERLHSFPGLEEVEATVQRLIERELARELPRRPGQREGRYEQLLGGGAVEEGEPEAGRPPEPQAPRLEAEVVTPMDAEPVAPPAPTATTPGIERRVARLEEELASLRADLRDLREELGA